MHTPAFTHDCGDCLFLGRWQGFDLYFCPNEPTVLARAGDDGPDYTSGLNATTPVLMEAHERAMRLGFIERPTHVTVYELGREYGGSEEGGWWYDTGEVVLTRPLRAGEDRELVLAALAAEFPSGTHRFSVRPRGRDYSIEFGGAPGQDFPAETPRYE